MTTDNTALDHDSITTGSNNPLSCTGEEVQSSSTVSEPRRRLVRPAPAFKEENYQTPWHRENGYWCDENGLIHRQVYEKHYGPIPEAWHIHHVDGNKINNDFRNLVAIPKEVHEFVHTWQGHARNTFLRPFVEYLLRQYQAGKDLQWSYHKYTGIKWDGHGIVNPKNSKWVKMSRKKGMQKAEKRQSIKQKRK
jgi:hypothetical protein